MKTISILGCGWLGFPLAKRLVKEGHKVNGAVRSENKLLTLHAEGITPFQLELLPGTELNPYWRTFLSCQILVIAIPPGTRHNPEGTHEKQMRTLLHLLNSLASQPYVIYVSSTSVYPLHLPVGEETTEITDDNTGHKDIFWAEKIWREEYAGPAVIMRMGGLAGADRLFARLFAGKTGLTNGNYPVNFVHQDDAVSALLQVAQHRPPGTIYNICSPQHPLRKHLYAFLAEKYNFAPPGFEENTPAGKIIDSSLFIEATGFIYQFEDPFSYTYSV